MFERTLNLARLLERQAFLNYQAHPTQNNRARWESATHKLALVTEAARPLAARAEPVRLRLRDRRVDW